MNDNESKTCNDIDPILQSSKKLGGWGQGEGLLKTTMTMISSVIWGGLTSLGGGGGGANCQNFRYAFLKENEYC